MSSVINATLTNGIQVTADNSGSLQLATNTGTTAMTIDTSQNVGIGTSSPQCALDVQASSGVSMFRLGVSTGTSAVYSRYGNTGGYLYLGRDNSSGTDFGSAYAAGIWSTGAYPMLFGTNGAERMRIDSTGNVLVGTTSGLNNNKLFVQGTSLVAGINVTNGTGEAYRFYSNGTAVGTISVTGSTTTYNTSSDYRLKENIAPMLNALGIVAQLKPVTYNWKADGSEGQGFIAHELQAVVPDCVTGEKDAVDKDGNPQYQGIDTSFLVATLTAAIQEQQAIITSLTARIEALENK